jgi:integrase
MEDAFLDMLNKRRSVPMTSMCRYALEHLCKGKMSHEKIWPDNITSGNISRVIRMWKAKRGLPEDDEACFHTFRHTCCSRLVQRGVPIVVVQKWMGHATIQTTMRYAHLAPDSLDIALKALEGDDA